MDLDLAVSFHRDINIVSTVLSERIMESTPAKLNFGKSLLVPSVQELAKEHLTNIPARYVHSEQESPAICAGASVPTVPVIDLQKLISGDSMNSELQKLHSACQEWGFLQVINHGVTSSLLEDFKREVIKLFSLPMEEKKKLWQQEDSLEGFGQAFVFSEEQKLDWSDMFAIFTLPPHIRKADLFQKLPSNLRDTMEAYCKEIKSLAMIILNQLAKALRMDEKEIRELFSDAMQSMRMNYYPPCPEPDRAIGLSPHSDADALTILFQLNETEGLQVRKDGTWVPIKQLPNALIVNIGDMMEIVSNGVYKSIEHRATVNSNEERLSVATFYHMNLDSELGPAHSLIGPHNPAIFRRVPVQKYLQDYFARKLDGKSYVDFMKERREG
ncbi:protein SRG1-like [Lycium ferocissimum]|uniref:protein SRG1-like n=1 Tax=Lycium ferocissimum TaxID=112874 RepID=UPI002815A775|nr:protein SRG1-like [Lycium ferocissimum]